MSKRRRVSLPMAGAISANAADQFGLNNPLLDGAPASGSRFHSTPPSVNPEFKALIDRIKEASRYPELERHLTPRELEYMKCRFDSDPPMSMLEIERSTGISMSHQCHLQKRIMKKATCILESKPIRVKMPLSCYRRKLVETALKLVAARTEDGTFEGIRSKFNKTETRVFEVYVLANPRISVQEAADLLRISKPSLNNTVKDIIDRLEGNERGHHRMDKYERMDIERLEALVCSLDVANRTGVRDRNRGLYLVAKRRGVLDELFPARRNDPHSIFRKLREEHSRLSEMKTQEEILLLLKPIEAEYLNRAIIPLKPVSDGAFQEEHGLTMHQLIGMKRKMLRKLKGEKPPEQNPGERLRDLRACCEKLGAEGLEQLKPGMEARDILILEKRVLANEPLTLQELGVELGGITKERARQLEAKLLKTLLGDRLRAPEPQVYPIAPKKQRCGKNVRTIREMIIACGGKDQISGLLTAKELDVVNIYVLTDKSRPDAVSGLGICNVTLDVLMRKIGTKFREHLQGLAVPPKLPPSEETSQNSPNNNI